MKGHIWNAADEISSIQVGTGYESVTIGITAALEAARALDAAGLLVTPEHDAAVAAEAWSEGVIAGYKDRIRDEEDPLPGGYLHHTPNPYEREAGESDADA